MNRTIFTCMLWATLIFNIILHATKPKIGIDFLRPTYLTEIHTLLKIYPICGILGPHKIGKSNLIKEYIQIYYPNNTYILDLHDFNTIDRLDNPILTLSSISADLIVIDGIERRPELFSILKVLTEPKSKKRKFLVLGNASRAFIRQTQSLIGRIGYIELSPLSLEETSDNKKLWLRGGFPTSYLAETNHESYKWRINFINNVLERDIPNLGFYIPHQQLWLFWRILSNWHGKMFNARAIGRSLGVSDHTAKRYLEILAGTFMVRVLSPWIEIIPKRQVKAPKVYFKDSGILHALMDIESEEQLLTHPSLASLWEGFALEEIIKTLRVDASECYYWATQAGAKLDLFIMKGGKRLGFEFKYTDSPRTTKSMHSALNDLKLDHLIIVYPGDQIFPLSEKISLYGLETIATGTFAKKIFELI